MRNIVHDDCRMDVDTDSGQEEGNVVENELFTAAKHYPNRSEMKNCIPYDMLKHFLFRDCLPLISNKQRCLVNRTR
jgi:hypothetical protein